MSTDFLANAVDTFAAQGATIPKILHQMWLDRSSDTNESPPPKYQAIGGTNSLRTLNPAYRYVFWNMQRVKQLFELPELQRWHDFYFTGLKHHIEKCDFARYALLYIYGGIYTDLDLLCVKPLDGLIAGRHFAWCEDRHGKDVYNGFLASAPRHPIWPELMNYIMYTYKNTGFVYDTTGPINIGLFAAQTRLTDRADIYVDTCVIGGLLLPSRRVCPKDSAYLELNDAAGSCWQLNPATVGAWIRGGARYQINKHCSSIMIGLLVLILLLMLAIVCLLIVVSKKPPTSITTTIPGNVVEQTSSVLPQQQMSFLE